MSRMSNENIEWSLYWAQDRLNSCVAAEGVVDQKRLTELWTDLALSLDGATKVLDLATGNGAVPVALLNANDELDVTAVDKADIDPVRYLGQESELLKAVTFISNTDIRDLSSDDFRFGVITSQYGIEYADLGSVAGLLSDLLYDGGRLKFLMHHEKSSILNSSLVKLDELNSLLCDDGVFDRLANFLQGECTLQELEGSAIEHQKSGVSLSKHISGQVLEGIGRVLTGLKDNPKESVTLATTLTIRVRAEHARLLQMKEAALSEQEIADFANLVIESGITDVTFKPFYTDQADESYLLGWLFQAVKQ